MGIPIIPATARSPFEADSKMLSLSYETPSPPFKQHKPKKIARYKKCEKTDVHKSV
jgi:hypothetical protein